MQCVCCVSFSYIKPRPHEQHCRRLYVEQFFRQSRMSLQQSRTLLRHCCWYELKGALSYILLTCSCIHTIILHVLASVSLAQRHGYFVSGRYANLIETSMPVSDCPLEYLKNPMTRLRKFSLHVTRGRGSILYNNTVVVYFAVLWMTSAYVACRWQYRCGPLAAASNHIS